MLCAQFLLRKRSADPAEYLPLPCRSWRCQYCAPNRRRQLMAQAASGEPNKLLTLTVNANTGDSPSYRRDLLHTAWRNLVKRIHRQFQLPPERRWQLASDPRTAAAVARDHRIDQKTPAKEIRAIPYFAFLERTKRGEPHLHILLRLPFIPQPWLAEQMRDLAGSPVVWIEAIKGSKHAIAYVTKYVTKEPAQWGNKKRYWRSRNWPVNQGTPDAPAFDKPRDVELLRTSWRDFAAQKVRERWTFETLETGWIRLHKPGAHPGWQQANQGWEEWRQPPPMPPSHPGLRPGIEGGRFVPSPHSCAVLPLDLRPGK